MTRHAGGRPRDIAPAVRPWVFFEFNELMRVCPDIPLAVAHAHLATWYGTGEKTVRQIIADYEALVACIAYPAERRFLWMGSGPTVDDPATFDRLKKRQRRRRRT